MSSSTAQETMNDKQSEEVCVSFVQCEGCCTPVSKNAAVYCDTCKGYVCKKKCKHNGDNCACCAQYFCGICIVGSATICGAIRCSRIVCISCKNDGAMTMCHICHNDICKECYAYYTRKCNTCKRTVCTKCIKDGTDKMCSGCEMMEYDIGRTLYEEPAVKKKQKVKEKEKEKR